MKTFEISKSNVCSIDDNDAWLFEKYSYHTNSNRPMRAATVCGKKSHIPLYNDIWESHNGKIPEGYIIDHIDSNPFNNQLSNLRLATQRQNCYNRRKKKGCASNYKGVYASKSRNRIYWKGQIFDKNKGHQISKWFPYTDDGKIQAAKWYDVKAKEFFGEFAKLNFNEDIV